MYCRQVSVDYIVLDFAEKKVHVQWHSFDIALSGLRTTGRESKSLMPLENEGKYKYCTVAEQHEAPLRKDIGVLAQTGIINNHVLLYGNSSRCRVHVV